jgi:hypothetical protein
MDIKIVRKAGFPKRDIAVLREAAMFFGEILLGKRMLSGIVLDIVINEDLKTKGELVNEDGTKRSRWFTIGIHGGLDLNEMLATLAHEMVHLKQHVRNEISFKEVRVARGGKSILTEISLWKGEEWKPGKNEDAYFDAPWEIEAYGREGGLVHRFIEKNQATA